MTRKKFSKRIEHRALLLSVEPIDGWALITREESDCDTGERKGRWHIAWLEIFGTKKGALEFARSNSWRPPFRAVRASLTTKPT